MMASKFASECRKSTSEKEHSTPYQQQIRIKRQCNMACISEPQKLIAFQKHDIHTYIHIMLVANPWPTIRNPMPLANALGNNKRS